MIEELRLFKRFHLLKRESASCCPGIASRKMWRAVVAYVQAAYPLVFLVLSLFF
ncbi:MAG: hypothetical protein HXS40_02005 [Theionarchaea archaeon]|nr:hypothetical protein [Theionarchaea archaeon]